MFNKKIIFPALMFLFTVFIVSPVFSAQLDIGEDIKFEYRYLERADSVLLSEYRQRIKFYLTGYLQDNIEVGAQFHSAGIMNSTAAFAVFEGAKVDNLIPYFEKAYITIHDYYGYPVDISLGKLSLKWADGVLINDNQLGLPAVLIKGTIPYDIDIEAYHTRTRDSILDISGIKGTGIRAVKEFGFRRAEIDYATESYESTAKVKRAVYGLNFTRNQHKGLEYNFFYYQMKGEKGGENFDGYALGAYGRFEGVIDPLGKGGAWIHYVLGTGDEADDEKGFLPILSSLESGFIGDFYARNREFRYVDGEISAIDLSHTIANLSMFRNALYATIRDDVTVFMVRSTYKKHTPSEPIGGSLTFGGIYRYSFINLEIRYTAFAPESAYDRFAGDRKFKFVTAAVSAKF